MLPIKTGTLTENKLQVQVAWSPKLDEEEFANQAAFTLNVSKGRVSDPLDQALVDYLHAMQIGDPAQSTKSELVQALPFDYLLAMSGNVLAQGSAITLCM